MDLKINVDKNSNIAIVENTELVISNTQDALDLLYIVNHDYNANKVIINKSSICEEFFDLKTGVAGEILQKYVNYNMKIAIVGDYEVYSSKSLRDFIYESNKGTHVFFLNNINDAIKKLETI